jgi:hypothetical protein
VTDDARGHGPSAGWIKFVLKHGGRRKSAPIGRSRRPRLARAIIASLLIAIGGLGVLVLDVAAVLGRDGTTGGAQRGGAVTTWGPRDASS